MEAHASEGGVDVLFIVQVTQFDHGVHQAQRVTRLEALVHLAQLQAAFYIAFKTQLAAGGRDIQQLATQGAVTLQVGAIEDDVDQLRQLQRGAEGVAALVVGHLLRHGAAVAAVAVDFADLQRVVAFPGDAHAVVEALNAEVLAVFDEFFTVARDHLVQRQGVAFTVHVHHVALEALAAVMEGDDQGVVAFLQLPQVGRNLQGGVQHLWRLRGFGFIEHGLSFSRQKRHTQVTAFCQYVPCLDRKITLG